MLRRRRNNDVARREGPFERTDAEKVHNLSTTLATQIHEAQKATQSVADVCIRFRSRTNSGGNDGSPWVCRVRRTQMQREKA